MLVRGGVVSEELDIHHRNFYYSSIGEKSALNVIQFTGIWNSSVG